MRFVLLWSLVFGLLGTPSSAIAGDQGFLESKQELLEALERDGLKVGLSIWQKIPLRSTRSKVFPALTRYTFVDADLVQDWHLDPKHKFRVILHVRTDSNEEYSIVLKDNAFYSGGDYGTLGRAYFLYDPKMIVGKWGRKVLDAISGQNILMGMTAEQVRMSWGYPFKVNTTSGKFGTVAQHVYGESNATYLYFENGKLTTVQD